MLHRETGGGEEALEELVGQRRSDEEGGLWRNLRLDWVRNWDQSCQTAVLLSRLQHTGKTRTPRCLIKYLHSACSHTPGVFGWLELGSCDSAVLWRYLTTLHDQNRVVSWIQYRETSDASLWPELTPELVNNNTVCSTYMRENILDLLARYSSCSHLGDVPFSSHR